MLTNIHDPCIIAVIATPLMSFLNIDTRGGFLSQGKSSAEF